MFTGVRVIGDISDSNNFKCRGNANTLHLYLLQDRVDKVAAMLRVNKQGAAYNQVIR